MKSFVVLKRKLNCYIIPIKFYYDSMLKDTVRFPGFFVITRTKMGIGEKEQGQKKKFSPRTAYTIESY